MIFRFFNLVVLLLLVFLVWPLLFDKAFLSSAKHLTGAALCLSILSIYAWAIIKKTTMQNRTIFIWVAGSFVVLEVAMTIIKNRVPYTADVYRSPKPYVQFTAMPGAEIEANPFMSSMTDPIHINSLGVRVESDMVVKPDSEKRVVVLGGSTVFNGTPLSNSIPGKLEQLLGKPYRVYNFGVVSYVSAQELSMLVHHVLALKPDIVITYDGGNDIATPFLYDPRPNYPYNFMVYEQGARVLQQRRTSDLLVLFLKKSSLLSQLFKRSLDERMLPKKRLRRENQFASAEWEAQIIDHYENNLRAMCALANGSEFQYFAFLQPIQRYKTPQVGFEKTVAEREDEEEGDYYDRQYKRAGAAFEKLSSEHKKDNCHFENISHSLENVNEELYWDFIHTNNRGNELIASKIHSALLHQL